jgi:hypothetical protein
MDLHTTEDGGAAALVELESRTLPADVAASYPFEFKVLYNCTCVVRVQVCDP